MEIGHPTDVKHVAHIGWDNQSGSAPSWMNEFKAAPDFSSSIGNGNTLDSSLSPWSSQDFEQQMGQQPVSEVFKDIPPTDLAKLPKKQKWKKKSSTNSPKSSSARSWRAANTKATYSEIEKSNLQM